MVGGKRSIFRGALLVFRECKWLSNYRGHYITNKKCISKGKSFKFTIHLQSFISPKWVPLNIRMASWKIHLRFCAWLLLALPLLGDITNGMMIERDISMSLRWISSWKKTKHLNIYSFWRLTWCRIFFLNEKDVFFEIYCLKYQGCFEWSYPRWLPAELSFREYICQAGLMPQTTHRLGQTQMIHPWLAWKEWHFSGEAGIPDEWMFVLPVKVSWTRGSLLLFGSWFHDYF